MSEYDNELRGALFKNKQQREGKKDPLYRGNATIGGVEYWLDCWLNDSKGGEKYMSIKFKAKDVQTTPPPAAVAAPAATPADFNDDIPF